MSNLLVPIILLISSIGLFFTYLSPGYDTLKAFEAQEVRVDDALQKFQQVITKKEELAKQYVKFSQPDLDGLKLIVPNKMDVVQVILVLDKLAQENRLSVESFGVPDTSQGTVARGGADEQVPEYGTATFRITVIGSYEDMKKFLYQIERSFALMDVVELMIESSDDEETAGLYTFSLAFNTYWLY